MRCKDLYGTGTGHDNCPVCPGCGLDLNCEGCNCREEEVWQRKPEEPMPDEILSEER